MPREDLFQRWLKVEKNICHLGIEFALIRNLKIVDVPVHYKERVYGETNISRFRHGWLLLRMSLFAARKLKFI